VSTLQCGLTTAAVSTDDLKCCWLLERWYSAHGGHIRSTNQPLITVTSLQPIYTVVAYCCCFVYYRFFWLRVCFRFAHGISQSSLFCNTFVTYCKVSDRLLLFFHACLTCCLELGSQNCWLLLNGSVACIYLRTFDGMNCPVYRLWGGNALWFMCWFWRYVNCLCVYLTSFLTFLLIH